MLRILVWICTYTGSFCRAVMKHFKYQHSKMSLKNYSTSKVHLKVGLGQLCALKSGNRKTCYFQSCLHMAVLACKFQRM